MAVARKRYLPHPIESDWCRDVKAKLSEMPRGTQERMREFIESKGLKCSSGELSEVLAGEAVTSIFVGPIHEFLGWPAPLAPSASRDGGEIFHVLQRVSPEQRAMIARAVDVVEGKSGEDAAAALAAMLQAFQSKPKND